MCIQDYGVKLTSTTVSILFNEGLMRMTLPTFTPLILTGVPVLIPQAWANSNTAWYFWNLCCIRYPLNQDKLRAMRTVLDTRNNPTPPSQMLFRLNPKSFNGRNVCFHIVWGTSKTKENGFFVFTLEGGWLCPVSADVALIRAGFLNGNRGKQFEELLGKVRFPTIFYSTPGEKFLHQMGHSNWRTFGVTMLCLPPALMLVLVMCLASLKTFLVSGAFIIIGLLLYPTLVHAKDRKWTQFDAGQPPLLAIHYSSKCNNL